MIDAIYFIRIINGNFCPIISDSQIIIIIYKR